MCGLRFYGRVKEVKTLRLRPRGKLEVLVVLLEHLKVALLEFDKKACELQVLALFDFSGEDELTQASGKR